MKIIRLLFLLFFLVGCEKKETNIEQLKIDFTAGTGTSFCTRSVTGSTYESKMLYMD
jgi:hypothetical protein